MIAKGYVDLPDGQIHYRSAAAPSGLPLVFLHRTPSASHSFEQVMERLHGWRPLYAFDTPGFGGSFDPSGDPAIEAYRDWFMAALNRLGVGEFHLCGHHTGTHFAVEIAAAYPDSVRSLLLDGAMYSEPAERQAMLAKLSTANELDADGSYLSASWNFMKPYYPGADVALLHTEIIGALRSMTTRGKCAKAVFAQDFPAILRRVRCPMLITAPVDDSLFPHLERMRSAMPHLNIRATTPAGVAAPELDSAGFADRLRTLVESSEQ